MPRSAKVQAHIVGEGDKIKVSFEGYDFGTISFSKETGASGNQAFDKLRRILDVEQALKRDKN